MMLIKTRNSLTYNIIIIMIIFLYCLLLLFCINIYYNNYFY